MRPKEPFNGFRQAQGNLVFHFAMIIGSLTLVELYPKIDENDHIEKECRFLTNCIRAMHLYMIISQIICYLLDDGINDLFSKYLSTIEIFFYQGTVFYELFILLNHPLMKVDTGYQRTVKEWILIEMLFYFFQMFTL